MTRRTAGTNTLNLCAGPGGWETGASLLDSFTVITGFDVSADACATARAAGYHRVQADVRSLGASRFPRHHRPDREPSVPDVLIEWSAFGTVGR